jgi:hypothetical protein
MFEYVNRKRDPITVAFYCGCVPFGLAWAVYRSLKTGFALEAYFITCAVFVLNPFEFRQQDVKQRWFWKIILRTGAVIHPLLLIGLWFLDSTYPVFVTGTGTIFFMAFIVAMAEIIVLGETVRRVRPDDEP